MNKISNLLPKSGRFVSEYFSEVLTRYSGFGIEFYSILEQKLPAVFCQLQFWQRIDIQQEDSYAVYNCNGKYFAIQLDPLFEVIVLWSEDVHTEIGNWSDNPCEDALKFVMLEFNV